MPQPHENWIERFPGLMSLPPELRAELIEESEIVHLAAGSLVFAPGQSSNDLLLLLEGNVLVQQQSETGRELTLYRAYAGDSCILSTACMLAFEDYSAQGIAETDICAVSIGSDTFDALIARSPVFRTFVFKAYSRRISDLFRLVDDIVFQRMDVRLASRLLALAGDSPQVHVTHQFLATELGTAREVISRNLAEFQRRGWVQQSRGELRLSDRPGLEQLIAGAGER